MDSSTSEDERLSSISSGKKVRFDLNDEVFEIPTIRGWINVEGNTNLSAHTIFQQVIASDK